jgi:hypothetical protein
LGRRPRVGDKGVGGLRVRLKGKAGDLGWAPSRRAGEDRGQALRGRWSEEEERKREGGRCRVGPSGQREREREREKESGPSWAAREEEEDRAGAEWAGVREERSRPGWAT